MKQIKCSMAFRSLAKAKFFAFCSQVFEGIYGNDGVFAPPITKEVFESVYNKFKVASDKYKNSPGIEKTNFDKAKSDMLGVLVELANYISLIAAGDASKILLAGFEPTKGTVTKAKILEPTNDFEPTRTKELGVVEVQINFVTKENVWYYCICTDNAALPPDLMTNNTLSMDQYPSEIFRVEMSKGRKKVYTNLPKNKTYYFYVFIGNSAGVSLLSDPKSISL
jgi:hypothetical protein